MQSIRPDASADCVRSLTRSGQDVQSNNMRAVELLTALQKLSEAIVEVETAVAALNANQDGSRRTSSHRGGIFELSTVRGEASGTR